MKHISVFIAILGLSIGLHAQCIIDSTVFSGPSDYGIVPDTVQNLPDAWIGNAYSTDLQFHVSPDTVTQNGTFPINWIRIDSVTGMPAGFTYLPNPVNGVFHTTSDSGTGYGCVGVSGNPVSGQETGGPNSDGIYPMIVYLTAELIVFGSPATFPAELYDYKIHIYDPNGVPSTQSISFLVEMISPGLAGQNAEFFVQAPKTGKIQLNVLTIQGAAVRSEQFQVVKGPNFFSFDTHGLAGGVYFCNFTLGDAAITRRITVTH
ncbi:MAG TPA: hypothetical protein VI731_07040 [Bacteroidia bacterium]|nr:hypothetical protein [Bacteroidia bacterium]